MEPLTELMDLISSTVETNCELDSSISFNDTETEAGLYIEVLQGVTDATYFNKTTTKTIKVKILCRSAEQKQGMEQLCCIGNYLQRLKKYPQGKTFSWLDTSVAKEPMKEGKAENGLYNFAIILDCKIYY